MFAPKRRPAPAPIPVVVTKPKPESARRPAKVSQDPVPIEALTAKRVADDLKALSPGESRVMSLRSGWSPSDTTAQTARGQIVVLPTIVAERAAAAGVCEIVETYGAPAATDPTTQPENAT